MSGLFLHKERGRREVYMRACCLYFCICFSKALFTCKTMVNDCLDNLSWKKQDERRTEQWQHTGQTNNVVLSWYILFWADLQVGTVALGAMEVIKEHTCRQQSCYSIWLSDSLIKTPDLMFSLITEMLIMLAQTGANIVCHSRRSATWKAWLYIEK